MCQQCNNLHDQCLKITPSIPSLSEVCRASVDLARSAQQKANGARKQFWTQLSSAVRKSGINVEQDVVLYDLGGKASFNYNAYAGLAWYEVTLPKGVKVEEGKVKSSLNGEYSIPNVDPMTVFNELGFIKTNSLINMTAGQFESRLEKIEKFTCHLSASWTPFPLRMRRKKCFGLLSRLGKPRKALSPL